MNGIRPGNPLILSHTAGAVVQCASASKYGATAAIMSSDGALAATVCLMSRHQYKHKVYQFTKFTIVFPT